MPRCDGSSAQALKLYPLIMSYLHIAIRYPTGTSKLLSRGDRRSFDAIVTHALLYFVVVLYQKEAIDKFGRRR